MWLVLFCITVSLNSLSFCSTLSKNRFDMWKSYQKHLTGSTLTSGKKESTTLTCLSKTMQKPFIYKCSDESASFTLVSVKMKFFLVDFESIICSLYHHSWLKVPNPPTPSFSNYIYPSSSSWTSTPIALFVALFLWLNGLSHQT